MRESIEQFIQHLRERAHMHRQRAVTHRLQRDFCRQDTQDEVAKTVDQIADRLERELLGGA